MRINPCGAAAVLSLALGCAEAYDPLPPHACIRPIEEFCTNRRCPTYDDWVQTIESSAALECRQGRWSHVGTCGDLRFTFVSYVGQGGETRYFDSAGRLVAASRFDDVAIWSGCGYGPFGFIPACEDKVTRDLCRP